MAQPERFDAIVIGSGQAGGPLAVELARCGRRTALVERDRLGGTCVNRGCTPTKTMVASAKVAWLARRAGDYGVRVGNVAVDLRRVRERKRAIVKAFGGVEPERAKKRPRLTAIHGDAHFTGAHTIEVVGKSGRARALTADWIFVNTGLVPARPPIPGLEQLTALEALDSTSIMELAELPEHLVVLGGGYVGVEFAQMFRRFGSRVTIVQRGEALLGREDPDVADAIARVLRDEEIEILLGASVERVGRSARSTRGARLHIAVQQKSRMRRISGSHLLVATGRVPETSSLRLEAAGIATDERGFVRVNPRLETSVPGVWALGDVNGGPAFTHISYDDYRIVCTNLLEGGDASTTGRFVPYTVYMDPELGRVGITETEARARKLDVRIARLPMDEVARALERDETRGFLKIVVDAATDRILGCAALGIEGGELMSMLQIAMLGKVTASTLRETIFAHPTLAEAWNNVFETVVPKRRTTRCDMASKNAWRR
jgi:pyruvate/2-oxoglutarate dehydrogenase complex dihydrolipoamide dehydrogenase (E3) component